MLFVKEEKTHEIDWSKALVAFEESEAGRFLEGEAIKFHFQKSVEGLPVVVLDAPVEYIRDLPSCPIEIISNEQIQEME